MSQRFEGLISGFGSRDLQELFEPGEAKTGYEQFFNGISKQSNDALRILKSCSKMLKRNYEEVLKGTTSTLSVVPEAYQFDSRINLYDAGITEELKKEVIVGNAKHKKHVEKKEWNERESRRKAVLSLAPYSAEGAIFDLLSQILYQKQGLLVVNYTMQQYMNAIIKIARDYRKSQRMTFDLTLFELEIKDALNISDDELDGCAQRIVNMLRTSNEYSESFDGKTINNVIQSAPQKDRNLLQRAKGKFKAYQSYTLNEIFKAIKLGAFEYLSKPDGAIDFLLIVPEYQMFIILATRVTLQDMTGNEPERMYKPMLQNTSKQFEKSVSYLSQIHGSILTEKWKLLKLIILPEASDSAVNKRCGHCKNLILTKSIIKDNGMEPYLKHLGIFEEIDSSLSTKQRYYKNFVTLFNRIVGLGAVRKENNFSPWESIHGNDHLGCLSTGMTKPLDEKLYISTLTEANKRPLDAVKILFYNPSCRMLLTEHFNGSMRFVILFGDFSTGKIKIQHNYNNI